MTIRLLRKFVCRVGVRVPYAAQNEKTLIVTFSLSMFFAFWYNPIQTMAQILYQNRNKNKTNLLTFFLLLSIKFVGGEQ